MLRQILGQILAGAAIATLAASAQAQEPTFLTLRGGADSGSWFVGSSAIAAIANREIPGMVMTPTLGAANRNVTEVDDGTAQYGFSVGRSAVEAAEGSGSFDIPHENLRAVMSLFPLALQVVARADSGIETYADLDGRDISAGQPGFSTLAVARQLLEMSEISEADGEVTLHMLNYGDANQQFQDRQLDVVMAFANYPSPNYQEFEVFFPIRLVDIGEELLDSYVEAYPGYAKVTLEPGGFSTFSEPVTTVASPTILVTSADRPDEEVYALAQAIFENADELRQAHPAFASFGPDQMLTGLNIPLHPGAERFLREAGVLAD